MRASVREIPTMRKGPTRDEEGCGWRDAKSVLGCYDDLCVMGAREVIAELYGYCYCYSRDQNVHVFELSDSADSYIFVFRFQKIP
jgi:hypothetical protein